jgi:hypothetical protein
MQGELFSPDMPPENRECRTAQLEIRANGRRLEGVVANFGTETTIGGAFTETIRAGEHPCFGPLSVDLHLGLTVHGRVQGDGHPDRRAGVRAGFGAVKL